MSSSGANFRLIFLGPPGAGKGTQAAMVAAKLKIPHISTGEMLRAAVRAGSALGIQVKETLDRGDLVSDDLMLEVVKARLGEADCQSGFLLDGYPRTLAQAEQLEVMLKGIKKPLTHVIEIQVPESVLLERILSRAKSAPGTRSDDNAEVAANRLAVFWKLTAPMIAFYKGAAVGVERSAKLHSLNGVGTVEEVQDRVLEALKG